MTHEEIKMTHEEIKQSLPHRWPFLLVDRVTKINEKVIEGYKNVSASDIVFLGHFPELSVFPGVLIVESLAQLSGLLLSRQDISVDSDVAGGAATNNKATDGAPIKSTAMGGAAAGDTERKRGFLTSIRSFKFIKVVRPGDQLFLKSVLKGSNADCFAFSVSAFVDKTEVATGEIQLFLQKEDTVL
jgi:3-hydroxyacyl-[acyl-carrier-protein] dehydratase